MDTKIIKGIIFLIIAILFLTVSFYNITYLVEVSTNELDYTRAFSSSVNNADLWYEHFVKTWHNYVFSLLFAILGILELKEGIKNGI